MRNLIRKFQSYWLADASFVTLRIIRFGENPYSFYVMENLIGIANTLLFIYINLRLLFRDQIVNTYRIIGAVNVYLLLALMGALTLEVIHAITGASIGGNVVLSGMDEDYAHFIYFSLTALTTVGFGDIYAVSTSARVGMSKSVGITRQDPAASSLNG